MLIKCNDAVKGYLKITWLAVRVIEPFVVDILRKDALPFVERSNQPKN